ncbi:MAG: nitrate- and nitrite sensing domain-containing protein [Acidovorax sp.]|uniref:nitrate- and nitrite sensing domain-containing protein n=1 Tax=Acidovorax sp. TaxID=1872122 RepID=UPI0025C738A3|nr:nitrate- and nitrite sensing domain-containing protein [Acidovorax sp.]MCE1193107.1 nitrate- and nitrite sensing domain-containing protein [Acidovorax sp.]
MPDSAHPLTVSSLVLRSKQLEIDAVRHLAQRAELVDVIGQLIQGVQRERGASGAYLASRAQRFADMRLRAVEEVRPLEARLRDVFAQHAEPAQGATAKTLSLMAWALLGVESLPALRSQIERQAMTAHDTVAAYSHLIAGLVELVFHVADAAGLPSVSRLLVALLHLVQAQEEAGQERALGAILYASGRSNEAHQQRVLHLMDAQERSLKVFAEFAEPALRDQWERLQLVPGVAQLERLRRTLCTARPGAALDSDLSDTWFDVCTERINALWHLQVGLVQRLREDCEACIREAQQDLQDSRGLLRGLRDNPPQRAHAVDRFFDMARTPADLATLAGGPHEGESSSLVELLQGQAARMASMEAELEAARRALNERKVIERAKGVLMARLGLNEEAAFRVLQKTSMDQNRRLLEVAEATLSLPDLAFAARSPQGSTPSAS